MGVKWTQEQEQVISLHNRDILVSAAAGSGKTAVLVERILTMVTRRKDPVDIDHLLVVTFTRAAAGEMKERILKALDDRLTEEPDNEHLKRQVAYIHNAQINTIDGFCAYVIRNYFHLIDLDPGYRTADEGELKLLKADVLREVLEEGYDLGSDDFHRLVECYAPGKTDAVLEDLILQLYEMSTSHPWPEEWLEFCRGVYDVRTQEEVFDSPWMKLFWADVRQKIGEAVTQAAENIKTAQAEDGPYAYLQALEADAAFLDRLSNTEDYNEIHAVLREHKWERLSSKKDAAVSDMLKERAKAGRETVKEIVSELQKQYFAMPAEAVFQCMRSCSPVMGSLIDLTIAFSRRFALKKRQKNLLDFTDMEHLALQILVEKKEDGSCVRSQAARELSRQFEEILIDEYQDSNYVQEMLLTSVSRHEDGVCNIFMVGDVKQSIYRFRLADPRLFLEKYETYTKKESSRQRIDLHRNFRSRKEVLGFVNLLFEQLMSRSFGGVAYDEGAALYPGAEYPGGNDPEFARTEVLMLESDGEDVKEEGMSGEARELEARIIGQRIREMAGRELVFDRQANAYRPMRYSDCVILLRTVSGWGETFGKVLQAMGIPSYVTTRTGYFTAPEIVTLLNYLHICDNPRQDIPFAGILHSPIAAVSVQELADIRREFPEGKLYDGCRRYQDAGENEVLRKKLEKFFSVYSDMRDRVAYTPIHELILAILNETGYGQYVRAMPAGEQRAANIRMLIEKARDYEKTSYRGLFNFVRYIEYLQKYNVDFGEVNITGENENTVRIMSIHKSKGLEFPVVFLAGMGKKFNLRDINSGIIMHPDYGPGVDCIDPEQRTRMPTLLKGVIRHQLLMESLGEEMRVLYVALTRAKEKLILVGTVSRLEKRVRECAGVLAQESPEISMRIREKGRDYWAWVLPSLVRHRAFLPVLEAYGLPANARKEIQKDDAEVVIRILTLQELTQKEVWHETGRQAGKRRFLEWNVQKTYDPQVKQLLDERFSFVYPYEKQQHVPVKLTVSELKQPYMEEPAEELYFQPDIIPLVPQFIEKKEQVLTGADRGTAYHRVFQLLDYSGADSAEGVGRQLSEMEAAGKITETMKLCVEAEDIVGLVQSPLGRRMKAAQQEGRLFLEQPFAMSIPASEKDPHFLDSDTIVVQGIIDAFFYEGDGIILVDYKTDQVQCAQELADKYHRQLDYYAQALMRTTGKTVREKIIYSVTLGREIVCE